MWTHKPRSSLILAISLDLVGQIILLFLTLSVWSELGWNRGDSTLIMQKDWLIFCLVLYPLIGWLFGTYTILRWRRLPILSLAQRLFISAVVNLFVIALVVWIVNPGDMVWLLHRRVQVTWLVLLTSWSFLVRIALRQGFLFPSLPKLFLLAREDEYKTILAEWRRVPLRQKLFYVDPKRLQTHIKKSSAPLLVAISKKSRFETCFGDLMANVQTSDPRIVRTLPVLSLFEQQQERLPPSILASDALNYGDLPWVSAFGFQANMKRLADLFSACFLILMSFPLILIAALLIKLEDKGPIFYLQIRSGWLGKPFTVFKLRTMSVQPSNSPATWTQLGDPRITRIGGLLRRFRLDELPQLFNVIKGDMSLIGPRPERPEYDQELAKVLPHYFKRYWMRPGLSGWAQVCAPYASSVDDSDLKLSYDLYYLKHFSTKFDVLILIKTIKIILKATGI